MKTFSLPLLWAISVYLLVFAPEVTIAADVAPCPPTIDGAGSSSCGSLTKSADTEYGPTQISGGLCPRIPASFPRTYVVRSESEFASAYDKVQPGEAIVIADGTYTWNTDRTLGKKGTKAKPIYITYENKLHGAVFRNSDAEFKITGSGHVIAGFHFDTHKDEVFRIRGPDNRIACHYFQTSGGRAYVYINGGDADRTEVDNNVFDGQERIALNIVRCNPLESRCASNPIGSWIHHNTWKDKKPNADGFGDGGAAIKLGSGWQEPEGVKIFSSDGHNLDTIIENNIFQNWNGESELISIKGDRNIIRNNCIKGSNKSNIVIRIGSNNLITGNWLDVVNEGIRMSGRGNYVAFNYQRAADGGPMFRHHVGELEPDGTRYAYVDASNNVLRFNVSSRMTRMVEIRRRGVPFIFQDNPTGNIISENLIFSASLVGSNSGGSYLNEDGRLTESQFRKSNNWGDNTIVKKDLPASSCGDAALFDGPGGPNASIPGGPDLLGAPTVIRAPSWW